MTESPQHCFALLAPLLLLLLLSACSSIPVDSGVELMPPESTPIEYVSSDLVHAAAFTATSARFGPNPISLGSGWTSSPTRYFELRNGVDCASLGPPGNSEEFAVKRPIRAGERYSCLETDFHVTRCFENCRAAVIERSSPLSGLNNSGRLTSYMLVHACRGMLAFSQTGDLADGIPLDAVLLRGEVGILAHKDFPNCRSY